MSADRPTCTECEEELDDEQAENPLKEGDDIYCDRCHREAFEDVCDRCQEWVPKPELTMKPGELMLFFQEVEGLQPGFYRVIRWPLYADGMITGYVFKENIAYAGPLDAECIGAAKEAYTPGGCLCKECRDAVEKSLTEPTTQPT